MEDWYWACRRDGPALDHFVIELGQDDLWRRVRSEIASDGKCLWNMINRNGKKTAIDDLLYMALSVIPANRVNHNRFVLEAAKIPVFAKFLRTTPADLCNYVSNSRFDDLDDRPEPYSDEMMRQVGDRVNRTLGKHDTWF